MTIYSSVIFASISYTVEPQALGTAYGIAISVNNMGQAYASWQLNYITEYYKHYEEYGYFQASMFLIGLNIIGLLTNITLFIIDIKKHNGVLHNVGKVV